MRSTITEYSETEAALAILREQYGKSYDVTTPAGMKDAKEARARVKGYRVALEKLRVEIKAPALDRCRLIDEEAKRITTELLAIEEPIDATIKAQEARKEAEKARAESEKKKRADDAAADCQLMRAMLTKAASERAHRIVEAIEIVRAVPVPENEHSEVVSITRDGVIEEMTKLHAAALAREAEEARIAAERADLERQKAEAERVARETAAKAEAEAKAERNRIAAEEKAHRDRVAAEQQAARERILAEERAADERRREADRQAAAERDMLAAEAKKRRNEEEARLRAEREKLEAERAAAEAKARAEREAEEAKQRAIESELRRRLDAREMLSEFVRLYGDLPEHAVIADDIRDHLAMLDSLRGEAA